MSAVTVSILGKNGAQPCAVSMLQYGLGFSIVLTVMKVESLSHPNAEITVRCTVRVVLSVVKL